MTAVYERAKAAERRRQQVDRWAYERLIEFRDELAALGVASEVDWGRTAWEPCLHVDTARGRETVWCRPVAVRVECGLPIYRMRFCWNDDPRLIGSCTYPASDVRRAAGKLVDFVSTPETPDVRPGKEHRS